MQEIGSGLTRYRSAPSSFFDTLLNNDSSTCGGFGLEELLKPRGISSETEKALSKFMTGSDTVQENRSSNVSEQFLSQSISYSHNLPPRNSKAEVKRPHQQRLKRHQSNDYSQMSMYQTDQSVNSEIANVTMNIPEVSSGGSQMSVYPNQQSVESNPMMKNLFSRPIKIEPGSGGASSSLTRHNSSPAGLFANINIEKEFGATRGMGNFASSTAEAPFSASSSFNSPNDFTSTHFSSSNMMTPVSEIGSKGIGPSVPGRGQSDQGVQVETWNDSTILSDNFVKGLAEDDSNAFSNENVTDDQKNEGGDRPTTRLAHQLSLPTSAAELSAIEKLLHDPIPFKLRAKRGSATHPRSIAERVRRTKISDRIRKLEELVPNMDRQTNTSDMLDLAVEYIKHLQTQAKRLQDARARCSCSARQRT